MARKKVLLHIGPRPLATTSLHAALADFAGQDKVLDGVDHGVLDVDPEALEHASLEMLKEHRSAGLKRKDVEGSWAAISRLTYKARRDLVISQPHFHTATPEQVSLILDSLMGLETHVVITPGEGEDAAAIAPAWVETMRKKRLHVAPLDDGAEVVDLAESLAGVALCIQDRELEKKITKLTKRRKRVRKEIRLLEAS